MRKISLTALALGLLVGLPASAEDGKSLSPTPRQMAHCMMARTKANHSENYKTAFKACKEQLGSGINESHLETAMNKTIGR